MHPEDRDPAHLWDTWKEMVGFRNILPHDYGHWPGTVGKI